LSYGTFLLAKWVPKMLEVAIREKFLPAHSAIVWSNSPSIHTHQQHNSMNKINKGLVNVSLFVQNEDRTTRGVYNEV